MNAAQKCPKCGAELTGAFEGLCPACMVRVMRGLNAAPSDSPAPGSSLHTPRVHYFGDYELLEEIARGGMGVVFKARQVSLNRIVALKMILAGKLASPALVLRFHTEAEAAANLKHPNIVAIHEVGEHDGQHYFSMDYIAGQSLAERVRQGPMPLKEAAGCIQIIAGAIHYAHQRGVLHRDLKPSNILLDAQGQPHVTDFGLAKLVEQESSLTQSEAILGTPGYMSPEQAAGEAKQLTTAADIYSLGAIFYELLTGQPPFRASTALETMRRVMEEEPVPPSFLRSSRRKEALTENDQSLLTSAATEAVDRDLETICLKCLRKDPDARYGSAEALAEDLARWQNGEPIHARPIGPTARLWRWCRRKPAFASTLGFAIIALLIGFATTSWQWRRAEASTISERHERERAEMGESNAVHQLYIDHMNLAQTAWEQNNLSRLRQLLEETATAPERGFEWYYWQRQLHLELRTLRGHVEPILAVAYSPDGRRIVTGSADRTAKVWDAATGKLQFSLEGHIDVVRSVAFSPDGQRILTGSWDGTAMLWDATAGKQVRALRGHTAGIFSAAFSPDGQRIITGSRDQTAKVWNATDGTLIRTLQGHNGVIWSVAFSPDGERIVTGGWDHTAMVWAATNGSLLLTFRGHADPVFSVAFSPDGERIVSGSFDQTAKVWESANGHELFTLQGHSAPVFSATFSTDGQWIATAGDDQTVRVWDANSRRELLTVKRHGSEISSVAFSPDSQRMVTGGGSVDFSPDGIQQIHARRGDRAARIWEVSNDKELLALKGHSNRVLSVAFSPDGQRIVTGSLDQTAKLWETATGKELGSLNGHTGAVRSVAFSLDGRRIVTGSWDNTAKVWDAASGQPLLSLIGHTDLIMSVAFSPDGRRVATGSQDHTAKVWDAVSGKELLTLKGPIHWAWAVAFSPDGRRILTGNGATEEQIATVWDAESGTELFPLKGYGSSAHCAAFSADGQRIVTGGDDHTAAVWNAANGARLLTLRGHSDIIMSARFSPDGQRIVTGSRDQTAKVWDAVSGKELLTLKGGWIFSVAFSPDGHRIVAGSGDRTARIWEAASAEKVANWQKEERSAAAAATEQVPMHPR